MHKNKNTHICNNCGNRGHFFKHCRLPISSFGVLLYRMNIDNIIEYLMICRKKTFGYIDFISGNYLMNDNDHILNMFKQMTIYEKQLIQQNDFDILWDELWRPINKENLYYNNIRNIKYSEIIENLPKTKYDYIKKRCLINLIEKSSTFGSWLEPEWEFPKGRKNHKESEYECAMRETMEETGYNCELFKEITFSKDNIFDESFIGSNNKKYRHKYFVMSLDYLSSLSYGEFDTSEVSTISWKTFNECNISIRPYNIEKKKVLAKINNYLHNNTLVMHK